MSLSLVWLVGWGILDTFLRYLFLKEMLGIKYRYTYLWFYLGTLIYAQINVRFHLAGTALGNQLYLCVCAFALNILLFQGSIIKKCFFTLWIYGVPEVASNIFLPLCSALAILNGQDGCSDTVLRVISLASCLVLFLLMRILQQKLYLLKRDFGEQEAVYLISMIVFICSAVDMIGAMFVSVSSRNTKDVIITAVLCSLIALGGEILYIYSVLMLESYLVKRLAKQQYQLLEQYLISSKEQYDQIIKVQHDTKNHVLCLAQLLTDGRTKDALNYLKSWNICNVQNEALVQTGSVFADALLNPKYQEARKLGIDISIEMCVPGENLIAPVDLCCLLGNALDNAVEACKRGMEVGYPAGWIRMKSSLHSNYWVLEIANSTYVPVTSHNGRFLSSKSLPVCGVGLQNIRTVVNQYGGVLDLQNGACFTLNAMFPLPLTSKNNSSASSG